ncbi:DUF1631 family protein [Ramlibacter sp.]|uniref:DUF1631 family protein n=1 Tax=Ramlibacter sp. TaxID=1917967 RepID=UPI003D0B8DD4
MTQGAAPGGSPASSAADSQLLYRAFMKEASAQGRPLMQRVVARALMEMPQHAARAPDAFERTALAEAARLLAEHQAMVVDAYPHALLVEFAHAVAGDARDAGGVTFDSLELMGDDQMHESVEIMRTQQAVGSAVEAELAELNALVCALQGLKTVQPARNPLRPEMYVRALRTVTQKSPVNPRMRRRWLTELGTAFGPELARCYSDLCAALRAQGVREAEYGIVRPPPSPHASAAIAAATAADDAAASEAQRKALLNVNELRQLLAGRGGAGADAPKGAPPGAPAAPQRTDYAPTMPAAFELLQEMRQVDKLKQVLRDNPSPAVEGLSPSQQLAREVVRLMVRNIAADERILPPVSELVRALEPALLSLAMADPRFFSDAKHPARELLGEMTQRSLAWSSVQSPGFAGFLEPLGQAVEVLRETHASGAEPFAFALATLREAWGEAEQRERRRREKAVRALLNAEQRNMVAAKVAEELKQRHADDEAPTWVWKFVMGPWTQVIAQARLSAGATMEVDSLETLAADLLWSVQPRRGGASPESLSRMARDLPRSLRLGLARIDFPEPQARRFFESLAVHHARLLRPHAAQKDSGPGNELTQVRDEPAATQFEMPSSTWLAPQEAQYSGYVTQPIDVQPIFGETRPNTSVPALLTEEVHELPEVRLTVGAWVDLYAAGAWGRWRLTWASPHGTLFLFTHPNGKTQSMARPLVQNLVATGALRLVSSQSLVSHALDAIATQALRNSAQKP